MGPAPACRGHSVEPRTQHSAAPRGSSARASPRLLCSAQPKQAAAALGAESTAAGRSPTAPEVSSSVRVASCRTLAAQEMVPAAARLLCGHTASRARQPRGEMSTAALARLPPPTGLVRTTPTRTRRCRARRPPGVRCGCRRRTQCHCGVCAGGAHALGRIPHTAKRPAAPRDETVAQLCVPLDGDERTKRCTGAVAKRAPRHLTSGAGAASLRVDGL